MDPITAVGLASSVVQLADAAFKIVKLLDTIVEGGKDRRKLCDEFTLLWMTLRNLEIQFAPLSADQNGQWLKPIESLAAPGGIFEQTSAAISDVWGRLTTASDSRRAKLIQAMRWPYDQEQVEKIVARVERLKSSLSIVLNQAQIAQTYEMQEGISEMVRKTTDSEFKEILDWLSPLNFRQKQESTVGSPGTGGWLFQGAQFRRWAFGKDPWLWCYGDPGAGKTVIASMAVDHLRKRHEDKNAIVLIAFCSFDNPTTQFIEPLIASLLKQVFQSRDSISKQLLELYQKHRKDSTSPTLSQLVDVLDDAISQYDKVFIILDALDELSDDAKRGRLLETFRKFEKFKAAKGSYPQVMVTSRNLDSIATRFGDTAGRISCDGCGCKSLEVYHHCDDCEDWDICEDCLQKGIGCGNIGHTLTKQFSSINIEISAHPEDVKSYVNERIEMEPDLAQFVKKTPGLRERILKTVIAKAKKMFLLAMFHMNALADCVDKRDLEEALKNLPKEISGIYDQAMTRIEKLTPNRQRAVKKLFMWVTYAERPLKVVELEHATAISRGVRDIQRDHILSAKALMSLSAGIVHIDEGGNVRLVHETAEGYFKDRRETLFPDGEVQIAECCIAYLQLDSFEEGPCQGPDESNLYEERLLHHPFLGYAALHWGHHARKCDSDLVTPQALMFLRNKQYLASAVQALWYTDTWSSESWDVLAGVTPLHIASFFGVNKIVTQLITEGAEIDARDSLGTTPLVYAASKARLDVVETLLSSGASANTVCSRGSTPLLRATSAGHEDIVRRLLKETDIAINQLYASRSNRSALMITVSNGFDKIMRLLLERSDIDINLDTDKPAGWSAIHFAVDGRNNAALDMLVNDPRTNINAMDRAWYTPLEYAASEGFIPELRLLLDHNADPNTQDDQGGRPIQRAIDYGETEAVKLLLDYNVEWDFRDIFERTIIHAAACNNQFRTLRVILERCKGLDINAQGSRSGETALHDAARSGFIRTVQVLLEFGALTTIENHAGRTPVKSAKDAGKDAVLELLQVARKKEEAEGRIRPVHKADTFSVSSELPLWMAVQKHTSDELRERIARTSVAEMDQISPDSGDTALHLAVLKDRPDVVGMLLDAGADPNILDTFDRTALILACQNGDIAAVRRLVDHGADLNIAIFREQPAWEIAFTSNYASITTYLQAQPSCEIKSNTSTLFICLAWAAYAGNLEAARRLIEAGAPVHLKSSEGKTASQIAKDYGHEEMERYLVEEAAKQRSMPSPPIVPPPPVVQPQSVVQKVDVKVEPKAALDVEAETLPQVKMDILSEKKSVDEISTVDHFSEGAKQSGGGGGLETVQPIAQRRSEHTNTDLANNPIFLGILGLVLLATLCKVWLG